MNESFQIINTISVTFVLKDQTDSLPVFQVSALALLE